MRETRTPAFISLQRDCGPPSVSFFEKFCETRTSVAYRVHPVGEVLEETGLRSFSERPVTSVSPVVERNASRCSLGDVSSKNSLRVYWVLELVVGDGVATDCGAKLLLMRMTLSGVKFTIATRIFQSSPSRTTIAAQ